MNTNNTFGQATWTGVAGTMLAGKTGRVEQFDGPASGLGEARSVVRIDGQPGAITVMRTSFTLD